MCRILLIVFMALPFFCFAQFASLKKEINTIVSSKKATIAVSVLEMGSDKTMNINGDKRMPMLSVFKFHIALAVLHQVDLGNLQLGQKIFIPKKELLENTWSPILKKYPQGNIELSLEEILRYTVAESDNNGCDLLIRLLGGTEKIQDYIESIGIRDFTIKADEEKMHQGYEFMYWNTTTTNAANQILKNFFTGKILSENSTAVLKKIMLGTSTGTNKLVAGLPEGTPIAHKTGSSGKDEKGLTVAENDIGIVQLPDGRHYAISVLISDSMETEKTNTKIIADLSRIVYQFLEKNTH